MKYESTRGRAPVLDFGDVLLTGLADDGGLYVPESWPALDLPATPLTYAEAAGAVMWPYVEGAIDRDDFEAMVDEAYATFRHPDVCPLVDLGNGLFVLELFHGPTLAFKDVALQLVGRLFDHELTRRGQRSTIVVATSGDTGSAAIEACRGRDSLDIVVLHPAGRVSDVQRRQMTTVVAGNVHNVAVDGTFDDCQDMVKALFADAAFRTDVRLAAMNSINWARVMAQIVYYVTAERTLRETGVTAAAGAVDFAVPTGNFGNVLAGWAARNMGVPIGRLVLGSNSNDILTRWLATGVMEARDVHPTLSPSMDIQVSSNVERLLFELFDRDGAAVAEAMHEFRSDGRVDLGADRLARAAEVFHGESFDDDETLDEITRTFERSGYLCDPHTAVGLAAARAARHDPSRPMVALATAHPAKFPDAVETAVGLRPALPDELADLFDRSEQYSSLPNDLAEVEAFVRAAVLPR